MTWREQFEENLKSPAIGSSAWYQCIAGDQIDVAQRLVTAKTPVCVQPQQGGSSAFVVVFEDTDFVAAGSDDRDEAERFSSEWNRRIL
jgi:hypothetical protein